ncbi:MAG: curlin [Hyphomicrobiales bacterium]|nr:MAG: curlin [Hyphomicrobiales bacterium]
MIYSGALNYFRGGAVVATLLLLAGCSATIPKHLAGEAELRPITTQNAELRSLPPPTKRVVVAVYSFPDQTGQFTESTTGNSTMSNAVTQGGASLLMKALQDAGERRWFTVLDRARLDDTLKERQIVAEMRRIYRGEVEVSASALPPLQHAGIILQGGITGYDVYTRTGGAGARYLGIGADTRWQQDTVTVSLRAISTNTSEVLASVTIQKTIASIATQGNIFRYVALDRILEAEAGSTANEPKQIAVEEAIEKAVDSLIIEGAHMGIWKFADPAAGRALIEAYLLDKYDGNVPPDAAIAVPPATKNATNVVPTVPLAKAPPPAPAPEQPNGPPPPDTNEVVG